MSLHSRTVQGQGASGGSFVVDMQTSWCQASKQMLACALCGQEHKLIWEQLHVWLPGCLRGPLGQHWCNMCSYKM